MKTDSDKFNELVRQEFWRALRNIVIGGIVLAVIWGLLGWFVPEGWPMLVVNIICLLLSIGFGLIMMQALKMVLPRWLSILLSALLWIFFFGLIRGLF
ncbi:MAG: hypothetical protein HYX79_00870 [Chloroflexi bacterium]|nr:hypothetical protein [Chloroflexota bacterium]